MNKKILLGIIVVVVIAAGGFFFYKNYYEKSQLPKEEKKTVLPTKTFKILHIMSYHTPWEWTEDQLNGFKESFKDLKVEYKVYEMDTKRKSTEEWKQQTGKEAKQLIEEWKPDLVYTNDDNAQEYVVKDYVNSNIPFVFSGVNAEPADYGFSGSSNITGILEREHIIETVAFFKQLVPNVKKIAVFTDDDVTWPKLVQRIQEQVPKEFPGIEIIALPAIKTYKEYQEKIKEYQTKVDALALLGVFTFKDSQGKNVPFCDVLRWTTENSNLPDFTFWKDRISCGTLATVYVSGYEQGLAAGRQARKILVDGISPKDIAIGPALKGKPAISLPRAKKLGIKVSSGILSTATVYDKFEWQNQ